MRILSFDDGAFKTRKIASYCLYADAFEVKRRVSDGVKCNITANTPTKCG